MEKPAKTEKVAVRPYPEHGIVDIYAVYNGNSGTVRLTNDAARQVYESLKVLFDSGQLNAG